MTCLMDDRRTYQVQSLIGAAKAPTNWIGQNPLIRARLREALEGLGGDDVDHAMFCWFLWESRVATKPDLGAEVVGAGRVPVDVPEFAILPASSQRRSLFAVQNNVALLLGVVRECEQGIGKSDLIDFILQEAPQLKETSANMVINQALGGGLGLIRYSDNAYFPTDRGLEFLTATHPGHILRSPLVGRVFGMGQLLLRLMNGAMTQQDAARYLQSLVPTWTTTMPGSYIVLWAKQAGLVDAVVREGKTWLTLTDDGEDYASALPADFEHRWRISNEVNDRDELGESLAPPEISASSSKLPAYGVQDIIADGCFLPAAEIDALLDLARRKKNLVLQGPPGTGKTWLARRLAYALVGAKDSARVTAVQFQPSLSYEDFVRGWRPYAGEDGRGALRLADGLFLDCVAAARAEPDEDFVVVIEEINRGNPAQILGELLTLLEADKRVESEALRLAYPRHSDERVYVPPNLHVIGTMNLADRSLALVDMALRRRFAFHTLRPMLNDAWRDWCVAAGAPAGLVEAIGQRFGELNAAIAEDIRLRAQFCVGHSFVTPPKAGVADWTSWFQAVVDAEIGPLLDEYWYDDIATAQTHKDLLSQPL
ncbi:MAG: AAA family ATPase [Proteobacteria bacterium]|nr:AAA family ATPase [Pseudomonadota bacterium]